MNHFQDYGGFSQPKPSRHKLSRILDVLPMNPEGIQGWVPSEPRQNRQVAQNGDSHKIPIRVSDEND